LDLSHHAVRVLDAQCDPSAVSYTINWTRDDRATWHERLTLKASASRKVLSVVKEHVPARLAAALCDEAHLREDIRCAQLSKKDREALLTALVQYRLPVTGHSGCAHYPRDDNTPLD
jgi:predicted flavoprotein YhiN